jgi:hypothetical protein
LPRPAHTTAAAFALALAAAPALAAAGPPAPAKPHAASDGPDRAARRADGAPAPHAPQRPPLTLRRAETDVRTDRSAPPVPAKAAWFDDQGLRLDSGGLAYTLRF